MFTVCLNELIQNFRLSGGLLEVFLKEPKKDLTLQVFDLSGKLISQSYSPNVEVLTEDLGDVSSGIYVVRVKSGFDASSFRLFVP